MPNKVSWASQDPSPLSESGEERAIKREEMRELFSLLGGEVQEAFELIINNENARPSEFADMGFQEVRLRLITGMLYPAATTKSVKYAVNKWLDNATISQSDKHQIRRELEKWVANR